MAKGKDIEIELANKTFIVPNVVATLVLVGLTAGAFYYMDNPAYAGIASMVLVVVSAIAKYLEINMGAILTVVGKDEDDLPLPMMAAAPEGTPQESPELTVVESSKLKAWLLH